MKKINIIINISAICLGSYLALPSNKTTYFAFGSPRADQPPLIENPGFLKDARAMVLTWGFSELANYAPRHGLILPLFWKLSQDIFAREYFKKVYGSQNLWEDLFNAQKLKYKDIQLPDTTLYSQKETNAWDNPLLHPYILELMVKANDLQQELQYKQTNYIKKPSEISTKGYFKITTQTIEEFHGGKALNEHYEGNLYKFLKSNMKVLKRNYEPWSLTEPSADDVWKSKKIRRDFFELVAKEENTWGWGKNSNDVIASDKSWFSFLDYCKMTPDLAIKYGGEEGKKLFDRFEGQVTALVESLELGVTCDENGVGRYKGIGGVSGETLYQFSDARSNYWEIEENRKNFFRYASAIYDFETVQQCRKQFNQRDLFKIDGHLFLMVQYIKQYGRSSFDFLTNDLCGSLSK